MADLSWKKLGVAAAVGGTVAVVGAPLVISAIGFQSGGIVAGSLAAKLMSTAAIAKGGGIVAGSTVSLLQSAGVAGLATQTTALVGGAAGSACALITGVKKGQ